MRNALIPALFLAGCATTPEPDIRDLVRNYADFGQVDHVARVAPRMCKEPSRPRKRLSASRDEDTHGRKLYYLFAKDRLAYLKSRDADQPEGQILVKESWIPPGMESGPLFAMIKSQGDWIYAVLDSRAETVTAAGKLKSCMECHESDRTRDRMFGLQP